MNIDIGSLGLNNGKKLDEKSISRNSLVIEVLNPTRGITLLKTFLEEGAHKTIFKHEGEVYIIGNLRLNHHNIKTLLVAGKLIIDLPLSNENVYINRMEDYIMQYELLAEYVDERREVS